MNDGIAERADFSRIRYGQVWEDARVLLRALRIRPGERCASIASAGDNALSLLTTDPSEVVAVDLSDAQLHCLRLRIAAFRHLDHPALLRLVGSRPAERGERIALYQAIRSDLAEGTRRFWDAKRPVIETGIGSSGKFEEYFRLFRSRVLPLVHSGDRIDKLLTPKPPAERRRFHDENWDTWRWRLLFRIFFSRFVMGRWGRDPEFFRYAGGNVPESLLERTRHALSELDPSKNPYLHWILTGTHGENLPEWLREENFGTIRDTLGRLRLFKGSLDELVKAETEGFDAWNLSDIFEYIPPGEAARLYQDIRRASHPGARTATWNMMASRSGSALAPEGYERDDTLSEQLHLADRTFFYSAFHAERIRVP